MIRDALARFPEPARCVDSNETPWPKQMLLWGSPRTPGLEIRHVADAARSDVAELLDKTADLNAEAMRWGYNPHIGHHGALLFDPHCLAWNQMDVFASSVAEGGEWVGPVRSLLPPDGASEEILWKLIETHPSSVCQTLEERDKDPPLLSLACSESRSVTEVAPDHAAAVQPRSSSALLDTSNCLHPGATTRRDQYSSYRLRIIWPWAEHEKAFILRPFSPRSTPECSLRFPKTRVFSTDVNIRGSSCRSCGSW